jgi:tetratricopeptide (TPR) repeat protein
MIGLSLAVVGFVRASRARARAEDQRERAEASLKLAREAVDEMTRAADQQLSGAPAGHEAGRQLLQKAELLYGRFLEKRRDEPAAREQSGLAYKRLGRIHYALGNYEQSEQAYRQSVNVFETLAEDFPEDGRHELNIVNTMDNRADPLEALGRGKEADEIMPARREKVKGLVRRFPHNSLYRKMLVDECKDQGSRQSYEEAIGWFEGLLADHPSCRYELATLLMYFGTFLKGAGQLEEARQAEHKAEAIRQGLVALLPRQPCETRRLHMPWPHGGWLCLADYKVRITQVGEYQLYVRSAGHDNNSRSFYAWIEELGDGPGGTVADWYVYYTPDAYARFGKHWDEEADFERVDERVRDRGNGVWQIAAPGDYTITFAPREDGVAIDAFVFQLASLPAPEADGPPESERTEEMVFLERDGRAVAEAEHFADRTPFECSWLVVPGEDAGDTAHINFRGAGYVQALPDRSPSEGQWQLLTNKADAESDLGLWDKAIADYSEALAIMPAHLPALTGRGEAYAESGQWDKAIADYSKAIELDPSNPWAWHGRGAVYQQKKQWDKAIADCSKAIELNPDDSGHWQRRANVYSNMKQWDKAIADYSKAIELGDEWGPWEERFDAYLQLGEVEKGLADFSKAIELDPDNSDHWHRRADAYSNMGKWDKALADYSRAIEVDPSNSWAWSGRGEVYGQKRQWDKAFADYSRAIEVGPSNPWAWHGRSCVYQHKKQWDKAIADCSKAIELDPDYSHHWHRRADR